MKRPRSLAFTLLEMVIVMAVLLTIAAVALPSIGGFRRGTGMEQAARRVLDQLNLARQQAVATNQPVRVYLLPVTDDGAPGHRWRAVQLGRVVSLDPYASTPEEAARIEPMGRMVTLPAGFAFTETGDLSTLLSEGPAREWQTPQHHWPTARMIEFRPDGTTLLPDVPSATSRFWTLSLCLQEEATSPTPTRAITLVLDPGTGRFKLFN